MQSLTKKRFSVKNRNQRATARRAQVALMRAAGKSIADIARHFAVHRATIARDLKTLESERENWVAINDIIEVTLHVAQLEITGELTAIEARDRIAACIQAAAEKLVKETPIP